MPIIKKDAEMPLDLRIKWEAMRDCYILLRDKKAKIEQVRVGDKLVSYTRVCM